MTDSEWFTLIVITNLTIVGGGSLFASMSGGSVSVWTYIMSISTFGLVGNSGVLTPVLSAILFVLNIQGLRLIANYARGISG
jgi:hypothetical protein